MKSGNFKQGLKGICHTGLVSLAGLLIFSQNAFAIAGVVGDASDGSENSCTEYPTINYTSNANSASCAPDEFPAVLSGEGETILWPGNFIPFLGVYGKYKGAVKGACTIAYQEIAAEGCTLTAIKSIYVASDLLVGAPYCVQSVFCAIQAHACCGTIVPQE